MALAVRGALVIQGNHDLYATQAVGDGKPGHASVAWTQQQLSEDERASGRAAADRHRRQRAAGARQRRRARLALCRETRNSPP